MEPWFRLNDKKMYYKYLDKATHYFEFGSGGSTYNASKKKNIIWIRSVESDLDWYNKILKKVEDKNYVKIIYCDVKAKPNNLGRPGKDSKLEDCINYSDQILNLSDDDISKIDLILIDGRFRVACALKCFNVIKDNCIVIIDDFLNRKHYHIVLDYYDIIDKTEDKSMVVLKRKLDIDKPNDELIRKYEYIYK